MDKWRVYMVSGAVVVGFGLLLSMVSVLAIVAGFLPLLLKPTLWLIPVGVAAVSTLCTIVGLLMLVLGEIARAKDATAKPLDKTKGEAAGPVDQ